jgi:ketosteroid isomerase-like protein
MGRQPSRLAPDADVRVTSLAADHKPAVQDVMNAMSQGRVGPLLALMADDVTWRWMGVAQWSRTFTGKAAVVDTLFGGCTDELAPSSRVDVSHIHADGDTVLVEHTGHNVLPDGRSYDNQYCWVLRFEGDRIQEVREYMDTQLVSTTFGAERVGLQ